MCKATKMFHEKLNKSEIIYFFKTKYKSIFKTEIKTKLYGFKALNDSTILL